MPKTDRYKWTPCVYTWRDKDQYFRIPKVDDPVIPSVPMIIILVLKFDKVLKNNVNWSIL